MSPAQIWTGLGRYRAVGVTLAAVLLMVIAFPPVEAAAPISAGTPGLGPGSATASTIVINPESGAPVVTEPGAPTPTGPSTGPAPTTGGGDDAPVTTAPAALPANCDPATGRIKFPSLFAPPCVHPVADNGGATYQGVTADTITVVLYRALPNPAVDALLRAAGAGDTWSDVLASYRDWITMFQTSYETYGRRIDLKIIEGSGESTDDAAARADAIKVATQMKPFAVIGGPAAFVDELAQRGIIVITQAQRPIEYFAERAPFVYGTQMSSTQAFAHLAEYIGKRLAGQPARHAGDPKLAAQTRSFGLLYLDTSEGVYRPGVDYLERQLAGYGVKLTDKVSYEAEISRAQEQARVMIARLKDRGVTTVLFSGDGLAPIFLTQEATRQQYFPEWLLSGGSLVDTNFFGRTYDQRQWKNAFGISQLWIRPPNPQTEPYYQHQQFFGRSPKADASPEVLYQEVQLLATAIHLAGPNLNPATFRDGLFSFPPSGVGGISVVQRSWGNHGVWPFPDWTAFDNVAEVWWDPSARGADEIGNVGTGMFRFVDGGRRYSPGQWPASEPRVFDPANAPTAYDQLPEPDRYPTYPDFGAR